MTALNATAKATLKAYGVTQAGWARQHFTDGRWHGDACGCPDDRCMDGFHHDPHEECGCLLALLDQMAGPLRPGACCSATRGGQHDPRSV
jgi:hypothetical protein